MRRLLTKTHEWSLTFVQAGGAIYVHSMLSSKSMELICGAVIVVHVAVSIAYILSWLAEVEKD